MANFQRKFATFTTYVMPAVPYQKDNCQTLLYRIYETISDRLAVVRFGLCVLICALMKFRKVQYKAAGAAGAGAAAATPKTSPHVGWQVGSPQ